MKTYENMKTNKNPKKTEANERDVTGSRWRPENRFNAKWT